VTLLFAVTPALYFFFHYYFALENEVTTRFAGRRWDIPSRIYSDATLLYPGQNIADIGLPQRLARLNYHKVPAATSATTPAAAASCCFSIASPIRTSNSLANWSR